MVGLVMNVYTHVKQVSRFQAAFHHCRTESLNLQNWIFIENETRNIAFFTIHCVLLSTL